jgi:predicted nucleic acid-binding protein
MQTVLIDTDVAIDYLRGEEYARDFLPRLWETNRAYLSVLTIYELYSGMKEKEREPTEDFISACLIEPISQEIAAHGGEWRARYRQKGLSLTAVDCLIASTAILQGHKIATRNIRHYPDKNLLLSLPQS